MQLRPWYREFHRTDMPSAYRGRCLSEPFCDECFHRARGCQALTLPARHAPG